jgi:predicted ester cyclase
MENFTMTTEHNKALMRRFLEASVATDEAAFKELLAPDFVAHLAGGSVDRDEFVHHNNVFVVALSDRQFEVEDLITEGDKVMARTTMRAIHSGDLYGLAPTGKQIAISAIIIERIRDRKMVEHWSLFDQLSMMQQLGLVPPP